MCRRRRVWFFFEIQGLCELFRMHLVPECIEDDIKMRSSQ